MNRYFFLIFFLLTTTVATVSASGFSGDQLIFDRLTALPDSNVVSGTGRVADLFDEFRIMPNPVYDQATVQYSLTEPAQVIVNVFDAAGKLIETHYLGVLADGPHVFHLEAGKLVSGLYNLSFLTSKGVMTQRFIVEK
jgi:hypothetical protein